MDDVKVDQIIRLLDVAFLSKYEIANRLNVPLSEVEKIEKSAAFSKPDSEYED